MLSLSESICHLTGNIIFSRKCLELNPANSSMWKDWFLFELGHLASRDDEARVKELSQFAAKCVDACSLDLRAYLREMCGKGKKSRWAPYLFSRRRDLDRLLSSLLLSLFDLVFLYTGCSSIPDLRTFFGSCSG